MILLAVLWLIVMIPGRCNRKKLEILKKYDYAHRGLHNRKEYVPENSMEAFRRAMDKGYGMELDVHLTADEKLAVIHDDSLKRTCGVNVPVREKTMEELKKFPLEGTKERIPEFREVLELVAGRVPLLIEIKTEKGNYQKLCETVCAALEDYSGLYCIESFDPRVVRWLWKNRPELVRGQLAEHFRRHGTMVNPIGDFLLHNLCANLLTRPDFISYQYLDRGSFGLRLCRRFYGVAEFDWTVKDPKVHRRIRGDGASVIFENYLPERYE